MRHLIARLQARTLTAVDVGGSLSAIALFAIYVVQGGHL